MNVCSWQKKSILYWFIFWLYITNTMSERKYESFLLLQTPQLQGPEQQLHGGPVDGLRHLLVHRLRRRGASHLLRSQHLPPHWDNGETDERVGSFLYNKWKFTLVQTLPSLTGSRLHRPGGGGGRQEAGADQSREARSQLHDGLPHLQEGKGQRLPQWWRYFTHSFNLDGPKSKRDSAQTMTCCKQVFIF